MKPCQDEKEIELDLECVFVGARQIQSWYYNYDLYIEEDGWQPKKMVEEEEEEELQRNRGLAISLCSIYTAAVSQLASQLPSSLFYSA